jgi:hypothetical protein
MNLRPVDLPVLRADLAEHTRGVTPHRIQEGFRRVEGKELPAYWVDYIVRENKQELDRLLSADLYFVSADMASLAIAAADSMPNFSLAPEDVPSRGGFIYFELPLLLPGNPDGVRTWAASWGPLAPVHNNVPGVWLSWYSDKPATLGQASEVGGFMANAWANAPRLMPLSNAQVPFGDDGSYGETRKGVPYNSARSGWLRILKATWVLMQQSLARIEDAVYDRPARRRLQKRGYEPPRVRVVTLRRASGSPSTVGDSDREYHHQWIVKGHWRQQWYPSRGVHRPVWIAPHIKGPEGAPLIGGEKVYAWTR